MGIQRCAQVGVGALSGSNYSNGKRCVIQCYTHRSSHTARCLMAGVDVPGEAQMPMQQALNDVRSIFIIFACCRADVQHPNLHIFHDSRHLE
jgi:hypothetical protein